MDRKGTFLAPLCALLIAQAPLPAAALDITFVDVGEGEAIILHSQGKTALVDSGNPVTGVQVTRLLEDSGINSLDMVFITHPHLDHMGGIFHVLPAIEIQQRFDNGQPLPPGNDMFRWYQQAFRNTNYRSLSSGEKLTFGGAHIEVLNSWQSGRKDLNQNSLVLRVSHGQAAALLMADAGVIVEQELLQGSTPLHSSLLKVGHHGYKSGTSEAFVGAVSPRFAVVSTNCHNHRTYPSEQVIERLEKNKALVLTTCAEGNIVFHSDGVSFSRGQNEP